MHGETLAYLYDDDGGKQPARAFITVIKHSVGSSLKCLLKRPCPMAGSQVRLARRHAGELPQGTTADRTLSSLSPCPCLDHLVL
jgi:hypothetical protein